MDQHPYTLLTIAKNYREQLIAKAEDNRLLQELAQDEKRERRRARAKPRATAATSQSTRLRGRTTPQ